MENGPSFSPPLSEPRRHEGHEEKKIRMTPAAKSHNPTNPGRSRLLDLGIEVFAIILSVMLALAVNDWRESRKTQANVANALQTLRSEIIKNQAEVERARLHHRALVEELHSGGRQLVSLDLKTTSIDISNLDRMKADLRAFFVSQDFAVPEKVDLVKKSENEFKLNIYDNVLTITVVGDSLKIRGPGGIQLRSADVRNLSWETAQSMQVLVHMDYEIVAAWAEIYKLQNTHDALVSKILDRLYGAPGTVLPIFEDLVYVEDVLLEKYEFILPLLPE